jgi:hypothetical protein
VFFRPTFGTEAEPFMRWLVVGVEFEKCTKQ